MTEQKLISLGLTKFISKGKDKFKGFHKARKSFVVNRNGDIVGLNLAHQQLKGIPNFVFELVHLEKLFLNNNEIEKLYNLNRLHNLRYLNLKCNNLHDCCCIEDLNLQKLERLFLNGNFLHYIFFDESDFPSLKYLNLGGNFIYNIPEWMRRSNIEYILLYDNQIYTSLFNLPINAKYTSIRRNLISDIDVNFRKEFQNLKTIYLGGNDFNQLPPMPSNLKTFSIFNSGIDDINEKLKVSIDYKTFTSKYENYLCSEMMFSDPLVNTFNALNTNCKITI